VGDAGAVDEDVAAVAVGHDESVQRGGDRRFDDAVRVEVLGAPVDLHLAVQIVDASALGKGVAPAPLPEADESVDLGRDAQVEVEDEGRFHEFARAGPGKAGFHVSQKV
jgi:hypothetical protein